MSAEKTEQATPRKLQKAREKGEVWKSAEVTRAVEFAALLVLLATMLGRTVQQFGHLFEAWPLMIAHLLLADGAAQGAVVMQAALQQSEHVWHAALWPLMGVVVVVGLLVTGLQVRGVLSMQPFVPKAERFNPATNLKQLFSSRGLFDLAKTLVKVLTISTALLSVLHAAAPRWVVAVQAGSAHSIAGMLGSALLPMALVCLALYVFMAALDYGHQFYEYQKQQRMSKDEVQREYKEVEGDPHIKGHRRALGAALAREGTGRQLAQAKVVVTNPTHLSVAIAFNPADGGLPCVVAKGAGKAAMLIRAEARRLGIPITENKPLARRLYSAVAVGSFITSETFADVARLLAATPASPRKPGDSWGRV